MIDKYNEAGITPTEIEADGLITRAETLERINANKAKPLKECAYPRCENCDKYHGQYCTVPMVISKQIYLTTGERLQSIEKVLAELESLVYGEILGSAVKSYTLLDTPISPAPQIEITKSEDNE